MNASLMNAALIDSIGWTLLHFIWQGGVIATATALALAALGQVRAQHRYLVACLGLLACVAWPAATLVARLQSAGDGALETSVMGPLAGRGTLDAAGGLAAFLQDQLSLIVCFWAVCALVLAARMIGGLWWLRGVAHSDAGDPALQRQVDQLAARFDVRRAVRLRVVDTLDSPVTAGFLRPLIMVPASVVTGMPAQLLEALLAHEMAHIRRFDYLVNLFQNVAEIVLFYHPATWWISNRVRAERELATDELAAERLGEPVRLARALSELEKLAFARHSLAQAASGGDLAQRVRRLLQPTRRTLDWKAALPVLALASGCLFAVGQADARDKNAAVIRPAVADFDSCSKPVWPAAALSEQRTGTVTLGFTIGPDGRVVDSEVRRSSGHPDLDEAAREGISKCRFKPGIRNGKPFESKMQMQYVWTLQ
ncbi:MAG: M56 family metallopeptidase [Gammaproteobacteria bacterium]